MSPAWTPEVPVTPGWYWFYGTGVGDRYSPELVVVRVREAGPTDARWLMYVANGSFVYPRRRDVVGHWCPLVPPEPPQ